jgi:hypothetical protein
MTRYRTQTLTRSVPHTVGGDTRYVTVTDKVQVPIVPRDWDRLVKNGVSLVAVIVIIASVVWSTTSIGGLLARTVPAAVAYTAAVIFDATWITALAVEWLNRYNTAKAKLPRRVGHGALLLAMSAVCVHGWLAGSLWAGIVGGVISGLAKVVWTLVLHHHAQRLDDRTQLWVDQRSAEAGARLAMVAVGRLLADAEDTIGGADVPVITTVEQQDQAPRRASGTVRSAVRAAVATMPDATAQDVVEQLARVGVDVDADTVSILMGEGVTTRVVTRPTPVGDAPLDERHEVLRALYDTGFRPTTTQMREALIDAGHGRLGDSTVRGMRQVIEQAEPHLAALPPAIAA